MSTETRMTRGVLTVLAMAAAVFFCGCVYDVPITEKPTRAIETRLLGDWKSADGKDTMRVVRLDDRNYIVSYNGDLLRVYHSDVAKIPLVTIQDLSTNVPKYYFYSWRLADDDSLHLRLVNDKIIPDETKTSGQVRELVRQNAQNPELFGADEQMNRVK